MTKIVLSLKQPLTMALVKEPMNSPNTHNLSQGIAENVTHNQTYHMNSFIAVLKGKPLSTTVHLMFITNQHSSGFNRE